MITKNFRAWMQLVTSGGSTQNDGMKTIDGTIRSAYFGGGSSNALYFTQRKLFVGTNDTPATRDDYTIQSADLTLVSSSTIPTSSSSTFQNYENNTHGSYTTSIYTNNTNEPITIKEVGLVCVVGSSSSNDLCLFAREVITPVTIQPNETYSFTMKFE